MQSVLANKLKEQNITQILKFNEYGNKDLTKWVKRSNAAYLMNNWVGNWKKDIARSFFDKSAF